MEFFRKKFFNIFIILPFFAISACSIFKEKKPLTCPRFLLDRDTAKIVKFKEDAGKDITDRVVSAEILGYDGTCRYNHKKDISEVSFRIFVEAELGTAAEKRKQNLEYFVAIPSFYPKKEGKNIFKIELDFPKNMDLVRFRDKEIEIKIPIKDGKTPQDIDVYYGFQLTKDELLYNRLMRK